MNSLSEAWTNNLLEREWYPPTTNRASSLGYECIRRLYYERANPEAKMTFPVDAYQRMREGTEQEETIKRHLSLLGYRTNRSQEYFKFEDLEISGKIDGFLEYGNEKPVLIEIKTTEPYTFDKIKMIDDFRENKWWSKYLVQVTAYMKAMKQEQMMFIVKDRTKWDIKTFYYDFEPLKWKRIEFKCQKVNEHLKENKIPDDSLCEFNECKGCPFYGFCRPTKILENEGFEMIDDPELVDILDKREKLKKIKKEYEDLDSDIKERFRGRNAFIGSEFRIESKLIIKTGNPNPKPIPPSKYFMMKIEKLAVDEPDQKSPVIEKPPSLLGAMGKN